MNALMTLEAGHKLAHYEILEPIGRGGMGEVYRARDGKLGRDVAIKLLPEEFSRDAARLARFRREAKVLASLNHPNIAAIHGLEETKGVHYLVLEHVPGETLADRMARGPLPFDEAAAIATEIANALEEAHERGIVHRDLKPANIKLTPDERVKILDFGLAKAFDDGAPAPSDSSSPTMTRDATGIGVILGTPAYMSPEQARGQSADRRTDIWAFGVVLFEMLTGRRLFAGETSSDTLAQVLKSEPDWSALPIETPAPARTLLRRCLERDRRKRLGWAGDARFELDENATEAGTELDERPGRWFESLVWAAIGLVVGAGTMLFGTSEDERPTRKLVIHAEGRHLLDAATIAPDGSKIAYVAAGKLWIRHLDRIEAREVPESDDALLPFWSPESDFVGFSASGGLWKVDLDGGTPTRLCELPPAVVTGASWSEEGVIVVGLRYSGTSGELYRVSASGGELSPFAEADPENDLMSFMRPQFLPGGRGLLAIVGTSAGTNVMVRGGGEWRSLVAASGSTGFSSAPVYSLTGHLLYVRDEGSLPQLFALPFSLESLTVTGEPILVASNAHAPSVSAEGDLVFSSAVPDPTSVVSVDREGNVVDLLTESGDQLLAPAVSREGSRLYVQRGMAGHIVDLDRGGSVPVPGAMGGWTPEGDAIVFVKDSQDLLMMPADGSQEPEPVVTGPWSEYAPNPSSDGNYLVYYLVDPQTGRDVWYLPLHGQREPVPFVVTPAEEVLPRFSPDGRFVAYQSNTSGEWEIYVRPFPEGEGRWMVSIAGGVHPRWSPDGSEIYYLADNVVMAVPVETEPVFRPGVPKELFRGEDVGTDLLTFVNRNLWLYDVAHDGRHFVVVRGAGRGTSDIVLVENWFAEFRD